MPTTCCKCWRRILIATVTLSSRCSGARWVLPPSSPAWHYARSRPVAVLRYPNRARTEGQGLDHLSKTYLDRVFFSLAKLTPAPVPECKMQERASPLLHFDLWLSSIFRALQIP